MDRGRLSGKRFVQAFTGSLRNETQRLGHEAIVRVNIGQPWSATVIVDQRPNIGHLISLQKLQAWRMGR